MEASIVNRLMRDYMLGEKEAKAYLSLLRMGESTASAVAKDSGTERSLSYQVLGRLADSGLASFKLKNNVRYYSASDPQRILEDMKRREKSLRSILPALSELKNRTPQERADVEIFKGIEGFRAVLNDMFKSVEKFLVFGEQGQIQGSYPSMYRHYLKMLEKTGSSERVLVRRDMKGKIWKSRNTRFRYVGSEVLSPTSTLVYRDKVLIVVWDRPMFSIVITSRKIADSYRAYFEHFWKTAEPDSVPRGRMHDRLPRTS